MRRAAHRGGAGERLIRRLAAVLVAILAAAAIILGLEGTLSRTSPRDAKVAATGPPAGSGAGAGAGAVRPAARRPARSAATAIEAAARPPATAAEARLQRTLGRLLSRAGPNSGALVYDLDSRAQLYSWQPQTGRPPASLEKLWTTTAVMRRLGAGARLHTLLLGTGYEHHGVWHGDLYLRGGGDPTFGDPTFNRFWNQGYGPTANQLVAQLAARGIHRVTGVLYADESLFDTRRGGLMTNYAPDVPDFGGQLSALTYDHGTTAGRYNPATFAVRELALTMRASRIPVRFSHHDVATPPGAHVLAAVSSPSMAVLARLMDVPSDDLFAELLAKQLGVLFGRGGSISDGARVIAGTIAAGYGLHPRIQDGSGLSRHDQSSPLEIVSLLAAAWGTPAGRQLVDSLPTVGVNGTVRGIGLKTPAVGHCVAKTGTLDYVTNLAGYCSARNHHTLAFALFADGPGNATSLTLESSMIGAIAGY